METPDAAARPVFCHTTRLELRGWCAEDFPAFAALCADPQVMRYFPAVLSEEGSRELFDRLVAHFGRCGYGPFAVWLREPRQWLGFVGLAEVGADLPFAPAVEIVWRLRPAYWGCGYATEAAQASLRYGFEHLKLGQIVAFTTETNEPSQRVMQRLGMRRDFHGDFDHPRLPAAHPLLRHRLYRLDRSRSQRA